MINSTIQNSELVIARLVQIASAPNVEDAREWAAEALVCAQAVASYLVVPPLRSVHQAADELIAAFESLMVGVRPPANASWVDWQNGDGENVGARIVTAQVAYRAAQAAAPTPPSSIVGVPIGEDVLSGDWESSLYAAMDAGFELYENGPRDADGQRQGMRNDDAQIGVEFAMKWIKRNLAAKPALPAPTVQQGELPPLPVSDWVLAGSANNRDAYTVDQIRDYARAAIAASAGVGQYTHVDVLEAHTKGYKLGMSQCDKDQSPAVDAASVRDAALSEAAAICAAKFIARSESGLPREASAARACRDEILAMKTNKEQDNG